MKHYIYSIIISGIILTGCNSGGGTTSSNSSSNSAHLTAISQSNSGAVLPLYTGPSYINTTIINNSSENILIGVPDSDYLNCQFLGQSQSYNCGSGDGWNDPAQPNALEGKTINSGESIQFNMIVNFNGPTGPSPTVSLSVYGNSVPLFGMWQDGTGTPNPQNHYASQYANNILEIQYWDPNSFNDKSLFVGVGDAGGLVENRSYTMNNDGSLNLTITITSATPYTRTSNSVSGNSLCSTPTESCPNTLTTGSPNSITSNNGIYQLVIQTDGNLVIYNDAHNAIWATGTSGSGASYTALGGDGNFGVYKSDGTAVWTTNTPNQGGTYLALGDDGNLGVYKVDGTPVWTSGSNITP